MGAPRRRRMDRSRVLCPCAQGVSVFAPALAPTLAAAGAQLASFSGRKRVAAVALILLTQIPAALCLSLRHQSGTVSVMSVLTAAVDAGETHSAGSSR